MLVDSAREGDGQIIVGIVAACHGDAVEGKEPQREAAVALAVGVGSCVLKLTDTQAATEEVIVGGA